MYESDAPPAGFSLLGREATSWAGGARVSAFYTNADIMLDSGPAFIKLEQIMGDTAPASDLAVGGAPRTPVTVRGHTGLFVEGALLAWKDDGAGRLIGAKVTLLIWSEGESTFILQSNHLVQAELLRFAEGLK